MSMGIIYLNWLYFVVMNKGDIERKNGIFRGRYVPLPNIKKKIKKNEDIYLERKRESNNISSHLIHNVLHLIFASWKWGEEKSSTWWGKYDITIHISNSINPTPFYLHYCPILHCHLNIDKDITPFSIFHLFFSLLFSSH